MKPSHRLLRLSILMVSLTCIANGSRFSLAANNSTLLEVHPRLFFTVGDVATLRLQAATTHQDIWKPIRAYADSQIVVSPPLNAPVNGSEDTYRTFGNQLIPLAFACLITDSRQYCLSAKTHLLTYSSWTQWDENNHRDLGHAHMLLGSAIAYDWLYTMLTPAERQQVQASLINWAQKMYEASSQSFEPSWANWWRKAYAQNHYWINNSALGIAGLVLLGDQTVDGLATRWVNQATNRMMLVRGLLTGIGDGTWHEGIAYQGYGLTLSLPFLVNLKRIQGTDLIPRDYLRNFPFWRLYNYLPERIDPVLGFGDFDLKWGNSFATQNLLRFAAKEFHNGYAEWLAQRVIEADGRNPTIWETPWYVFEFLYYDPTILSQVPDNLPLARVFPDLQGVIWRTGWSDNDLVFGLKTGAYGGRFAADSFIQQSYPWEGPCDVTGCQLSVGHDHDDTNTFYLSKGTQWLAPESIGVDQSQTSFHNSILIDEHGQIRPPENHYGEDPADFAGTDGFLTMTGDTANFDYVAANATNRYKNIIGIKAVIRQVVFVRPDYFLIVDHLEAVHAHQYMWVCHFDGSVLLQGKWIVGQADNGQILGVNVLAPHDFVAAIGNDGHSFVRVRAKSPTSSLRFINLLYPTSDKQWQNKPSASVLEDNGNALAVSAKFADGQVDDILMVYREPAHNMTVGAYVYDGRVAVISWRDGVILSKLFVSGGSFLSGHHKDPLVIGLDKNGSFEAVYNGDVLQVQGNFTNSVTIYAPKINLLTVNGAPRSFVRNGNYITFGG